MKRIALAIVVVGLVLGVAILAPRLMAYWFDN